MNFKPLTQLIAQQERIYKLQPCVISLFSSRMKSVYVADGLFAILLNHATKFKEVKIREKVSPVLVSNG